MGTDAVRALEEKGVLGYKRAMATNVESPFAEEIKNAGKRGSGVPMLKHATTEAKDVIYVEVLTDLLKPGGQRKLAAYLLDPARWRLIKMIQLTPTKKKFRFMRIMMDADAKLPELDPLLIEQKPLFGTTRRRKTPLKPHRLRSR